MLAIPSNGCFGALGNVEIELVSMGQLRVGRRVSVVNLYRTPRIGLENSVTRLAYLLLRTYHSRDTAKRKSALRPTDPDMPYCSCGSF